jgi:hypothetical protein
VSGPDRCDMAGIDWNEQLISQLDWHWRLRLRSLTDDEYFSEPVHGCWERSSMRSVHRAGSGWWRGFTIDLALPEPDPPPVITIAWRMGHIIVGVLSIRASNRETIHHGAEIMLLRDLYRRKA